MATEREYLVTLGLAKEGRGRYSKDAREALDKAKADGMVFDLTAGDIAKLERQNKPKRVAKVTTTVKEARPSQDSYDAKVVRSWGEQVGMIEKGRRGKLPTALINAYLSANKSTPKKVTAKRPSLPRTAVRTETVGYTYARRRPNDPPFISEPLIAVSSCGKCNKGVGFCGCDDGPRAPKYLGGEILLLTRPSK